MRPPVNASGIVNITMNGDFRDWNCATMIKYTSSTPRRSISARSPSELMICSFSPSNAYVTPLGSERSESAFSASPVTSVTLYPDAISALTVR